MRYGIYGGSFDPIHKGHIAAAAAVRASRGLDRVFLIPAAAPPHKRDGCKAPFADRLEMARLAAAGQPGLEVLDIEGRRPPPSYTVDTVEELRENYPDAEFELLLGADMLADLPTWRRADDLVAEVTVVAFGRPGADPAAARAAFAARLGPGRCVWVEIPQLPAASSDLRERLAAGADAAAWLAPEVEAYIRRHGLYRERG